MPDSGPRVVSIIQARVAATRLPGKVLKDLGGRPVLAWVVERARRASLPDETVVATTTESQDDAIVELCTQNGYPCFRGEMHDVLDRYYHAAVEYEAGVIVRITADCPLIDPDEVDRTVGAFLEHQPSLDFATNRLPMERTVPIGLDTEVCTFVALETAWREANEPYQREHVMPYFYDHRDDFNTIHIKHDPDYGHLRWTLDTPEDLDLLRRIVAHFSPRDDFSWYEILELFEQEPKLAEINAAVRQKIYREIDQRR